MSMSSYAGDAGRQQLADDLRSLVRGSRRWSEIDDLRRSAIDQLIDASVHGRDCWPDPNDVCEQLHAQMLMFFVARSRAMS